MIYEYCMTVKDRAGVLNRITGFIRRNGWNVETVHVEPVGEAGQSRMSISIDFTPSGAKRFEQRLHEWNFIFESRRAGEEVAG